MDEFEKWFDALNAKHDFLVWKKLAHRDTALEAWNAALAIGEARGRVLGMGAAAGIAEGIKSEFSTGYEEWDDACEQIVKAIRQAAAQPVDHIVEPHALVAQPAEVCEYAPEKEPFCIGYRSPCAVCVGS